MKRIYDFSSFSKIYEAEGDKEKPYLGLLKQILSYINTSYMSQLKLTEDPYDAKIIADLDSVAKAPGVDSYKKILANVKAAVDKDSAEAKVAGDSWSAAGEKFIAALGKIIEKLPNNKEEIEKSITDFINTQKQNLQSSSKENELKKEVDQAMSKKNESLDYLTEGIFSGKKGKIKDISKEITVVMSILKDMAGISGMEGEVKKYQDEINHSCQVFIVCSACIFCIELYIICKIPGPLYTLNGSCQYLFTCRIEFGFDMKISIANTGVYPGSYRVLQGLRCHFYVFLNRSG